MCNFKECNFSLGSEGWLQCPKFEKVEMIEGE